MLSGTSEMSKDIVLDVSSDSVNNVFKPFGQRDSGFSHLLYFLFRLSCECPNISTYFLQMALTTVL